MREPEHWSQRARSGWNRQAYAGGGGAVECDNPIMKGSRNMLRGHTQHRRRFCPSAFLGYFLVISRRRRHVAGRHEVAQVPTSQRRRAHQRSTLPYNYAAALRICQLDKCVG